MVLRIEKGWARSVCVLVLVGLCSCMVVPAGRYGLRRRVVVVAPLSRVVVAAPAPRAVVVSDRPTTPPAPPLQMPAVMHWCAAHCFTWEWNQDRYCVQGDNCRSRSMTVATFTRESIVMYRTENGQPPGTAILTGKPSPDGNSVRGSIRWSNGGTGSFGATWGPALNNLPGDDAQAQAWAQQQRAASASADQTMAALFLAAGLVALSSADPGAWTDDDEGERAEEAQRRANDEASRARARRMEREEAQRQAEKEADEAAYRARAAEEEAARRRALDEAAARINE